MRIAADSLLQLLTKLLKLLNCSFSVITTFSETDELLFIKIGCKGRQNL